MAHGSHQRIVDVFTGGSAGDVDAQKRVMRELDSGPMVSVAAIDGQAWGCGAELCWACDLRVASEGVSFAQPEVNIGLTPGSGGISKVAHLAGEATALRLALDGPISAEEVFLMGLVHRVVQRGDSLAAATEWAAWLAGRPPWALVANKALVKEIRALRRPSRLRPRHRWPVLSSQADSTRPVLGRMVHHLEGALSAARAELRRLPPSRG